METQDHYLKFIGNIMTDNTYDKSKKLRKMYIEIDDFLKDLSEEDGASLRTLALARTNLETSLMYAIKSIAIAIVN